MGDTFFHSTPYNLFSLPQVINDIGRHNAITNSLKIYAPRLAVIDPVSFKYKNNYQRIALKEELVNTVCLLWDECEWLATKKNLPLLRERGAQLERCAKLLYLLENTPPIGEHASCQQQLQENLDASPDKPAKYIGLTLIAPIIAETMLGFTVDEGLEQIRDKMSAANLHRLNWVWGGGLDRAMLDLIPVGVGHPQRASEVFTAIAPVTGYMSFMLYYLRLGINGFLLTKILFTENWFKGTMLNPWRTNEDIAHSARVYEEFQTQWEIRKFAILNDTFWATANMACFFWLVGNGTLGYLGNALTGALLLFDFTLTAWGYLEKETEHNKMLGAFNKELKYLTKLIYHETDETKLNVLKEHLTVLIESKNQCEQDWKYTGKNFGKDLWYALGLLVAFSMLCCFFFPPAALIPATILILGVAGSALSFALTVGYHAWTTNTEIEKLQALRTDAIEKIATLDEKIYKLSIAFRYKEAPYNGPSLTLQIDELILERERLIKDCDYQQSMIAYSKLELTQQILSEALVPASAFALLVFLPLSLGLPILIPVVLLLMMSGTILEKRWKPKELPLPGDEDPSSPQPTR